MKLFFQKKNKYKQIAQQEDVLKVLFSMEQNKTPFSVEYIAGNLQLKPDLVHVLLKQLKEHELLLTISGPLSEKGKDYALQIVRKHRLYELYLAEYSGYKPHHWHKIANKKEHTISEKEEKQLTAQLRHPFLDPHGDPIPQKGEEIFLQKGKLLQEFQEGDFLRVVRVKDRPQKIFERIQKTGLLPNVYLQLMEKRSNDFLILLEGEKFSVAQEDSLNIFCSQITDSETISQFMKIRRLSSLQIGEEATITGISPGCRGMVRRRLQDLGFVAGSRIFIDMISPMGTPTAYVVRGTSIALRKEQSQYILIEKR